MIKHNRDEEDGQDQAKRDAPTQFVPDGKQRNFMPDALALHITPDQKIRRFLFLIGYCDLPVGKVK